MLAQRNLCGHGEFSMAPKWTSVAEMIAITGRPTPLRNQSLIAGLLKGNQWLIKPYFWGGTLGGRLTSHHPLLQRTT